MDRWATHAAQERQVGGIGVKPQEVCQRALKMCKDEGATDVVASVSDSSETMIRFSKNDITVSDLLNELACNIFVKVQGRTAGTNLTDLNQTTLKNGVKKVVRMAKNSPSTDTWARLPQGPFNYNPQLLYGSKVPSDAKKLVDWVEGAIESGLGEGAERMAGSLTARNSSVTQMTSGDAFGVAQGGTLELSIRAFGKDLSSGHSVSIASKESEFHAQEAGAEAGRLAKMAASPAKGDAGEYDAVLGPMVFSDLMNQVGRVASAFFVDSGMSFLKDKLDLRVAAENLSLTDDPTIVDTYGSAPFDAEGLPTERTRIVENGLLKNYLHNSTTAQKFQTKSTANAGLIAPHPFNLIVEPGSESLEALISKVENGIYVTNTWYLRYQNYSTGDFSTIPRDAMFLIKNGKIAGSIKELRISENMIRVLQNVQGLTQERKWIKWWEVDTPTLSPSALVSKVRFTSSSQ